MQIRKFQPDKDLQILETYLRNQYFEKKNMSTYTDTDFDKLLKEVSKYFSIYAHIELKL